MIPIMASFMAFTLVRTVAAAAAIAWSRWGVVMAGVVMVSVTVIAWAVAAATAATAAVARAITSAAAVAPAAVAGTITATTAAAIDWACAHHTGVYCYAAGQIKTGGYSSKEKGKSSHRL
jgi:hypothetical protein